MSTRVFELDPGHSLDQALFNFAHKFEFTCLYYKSYKDLRIIILKGKDPPFHFKLF